MEGWLTETGCLPLPLRSKPSLATSPKDCSMLLPLRTCTIDTPRLTSLSIESLSQSKECTSPLEPSLVTPCSLASKTWWVPRESPSSLWIQAELQSTPSRDIEWISASAMAESEFSLDNAPRLSSECLLENSKMDRFLRARPYRLGEGDRESQV